MRFRHHQDVRVKMPYPSTRIANSTQSEGTTAIPTIIEAVRNDCYGINRTGFELAIDEAWTELNSQQYGSSAASVLVLGHNQALKWNQCGKGVEECMLETSATNQRKDVRSVAVCY